MIRESGRFAFGENWHDFLLVLDESRIAEAERSVREFLGVDRLEGSRFLDVGSGSGLFSLAARRLGAQVRSFDYDVSSVACTRELKRRFFPDDPDWTIEQGSVLDREYIESLGRFDICYAWGVLHHTGALWRALQNATLPLGENGLLFIGIYNDQGVISTAWRVVKRTYGSGRIGRILVTALFYPVFFLVGLLTDLVRLRNPARRYNEHLRYRGMSLVHDWKDWLGGYPYEVAKPERVRSFLSDLGFAEGEFLPTGHGFGNNQFLFRKGASSPARATRQEDDPV